MNRDDDHTSHIGDIGAQDAALEVFLAAGRAARPDPSSDLMARIMADALAEMLTPVSVPAAPAAGRALRRWTGLRARMAARFGGWGSMGGLVAATLAGVWIGFAAPGPLAALSAGVLGAPETSESAVDTVELLPEFDDFLTEG